MRNIGFYEDLPFPETNIEIYKDIYFVEQWLRRILLAALYTKYGEKWLDFIPQEILNELKKRKGSLKGRILLDCENNSNVIWLSTFDELTKLFIGPELWPIIKDVTAFSRSEFTEKINFLREIRNIIGHNRATTEQTKNICESLVNYFRDGIHNFKIKIFFNEGEVERDLEFREGSEFQELESYVYSDGYPPGTQIFLWESAYFRELSSLPVERECSWVDIAEILDAFKELEQFILSIHISTSGGEYTVVWPKSIQIEHQYRIIGRYLSLEPRIWTSKDYNTQNPKYLCDPKIWFYSEVTPVPEAQPQIADIEGQPEATNIIPFPSSTSD